MIDPASTIGLPEAQGLYDPRHEHDACGIGFVANIKGKKSHAIIEQGIQVLINLTHRGACGCDPETGDGAGLTIQIPHKFFARECGKLGFTLPNAGEYGVGMVFLPVEKMPRLECEGIVERIIAEEGLRLLGWRDTPHRRDRHRARGPSFATLYTAGLRRARPQYERSATGAQALRGAQTGRKRSGRLGDAGQELLLYSVALGAHHRL